MMSGSGALKAERTPILAKVKVAKALSDEVRVLILDLLSQKPLCVQEIAEELEKRGYKKTINTIRYHLQILKEAGLIKLVGVKEKRGGVLKYYASNAKVITVEEKEDIKPIIKPIADRMTSELKEILINTLKTNRSEILEAARKLKACPYCITSHFVEYIILEALHIALASVIEDEDMKRLAQEIAVNE